jgi:hypothetical protein
LKKFFGVFGLVLLMFLPLGDYQSVMAASKFELLKKEVNASFSNLKLQAHKIQSLNTTSLTEPEILEESEPNNLFENANPLPLGSFMAGSFYKYDLDTYKITVEESGEFVIIGHEESDMNLVYGLIDENEELIPFLDHAVSEDGFSSILVYDITPGTYYILAGDSKNLALDDSYLIYANMGKDIPIEDEEVDEEKEYEEVVEVEAEDVTPPDAPKINPVDDNDKVITGKAEPGSSIFIEINGEFLDEETFVNKNGTFSIKISPLKADTIISASAVDAAGNQSDFTEKVVLDKTPPKTLVVNKVTTKSKTITGKTEAKALVEVKVGTKIIGKATADSKGNFKVIIKVQKKGRALTVVATDKGKNKKSVNLIVK